MPDPALPTVYLPFAALLRGEWGRDFRLDQPLWLTRAPGRAEVLGGPGEALGTATLALSLGRSVFCAIQNREDRVIRIHSLLPASRGGTRTWEGAVDTLYTKKGPPRSLAVLRQTFEEQDAMWMMRLVAAMIGLRRTRQLNTPKVGFNMVIWSRLPEEPGFGERVALATAASLAFKASTGLAKKRVDGLQVARAVVRGAKEVLGEDFAFTEALTCCLGRRGCILYIEHGIEPSMQWVPLPPQVMLATVDIAQPPAIEGGAEDSARLRQHLEVAAGMALAELNAALKKDKKLPFPGWGRIGPDELPALKKMVPREVTGAQWLQRFRRSRDFADVVARVEEERRYPLRKVAEYAVGESDRARKFLGNLADYGRGMKEAFLVEAGRLLNRSHKAQRELCRVTLPEADAFLKAVNDRGRQAGLFGGRLCDFGRSGIVTILAHRSAREELAKVVAEHAQGERARVSMLTETQDGGVLSSWWHGILEPGGKGGEGEPATPAGRPEAGKTGG